MITTLRKTFFPVLIILSGCTGGQNTKEKTLILVEDYLSSQLISPEKKTDENGLIEIKDTVRTYIIDPASIFTGLIDDDNTEDAVVTVASYKGYALDLIEHLFLINTNGELVIQRSVESDMKILSLNERIITAEVPTHPRSSPLFFCPECREVHKFRYVAGELVEVE